MSKPGRHHQPQVDCVGRWPSCVVIDSDPSRRGLSPQLDGVSRCRRRYTDRVGRRCAWWQIAARRSTAASRGFTMRELEGAGKKKGRELSRGLSRA